jgi:hypothetical protein
MNSGMDIGELPSAQAFSCSTVLSVLGRIAHPIHRPLDSPDAQRRSKYGAAAGKSLVLGCDLLDGYRVDSRREIVARQFDAVPAFRLRLVQC